MISILRLVSRDGSACIYCEAEMWVSEAEKIQSFATRHGITNKAAKSRRATREHLVRQADGGTDAAANLMLACVFCNSWRNERSLVECRAGIKKMIDDGQHPGFAAGVYQPPNQPKKKRSTVLDSLFR